MKTTLYRQLENIQFKWHRYLYQRRAAKLISLASFDFSKPSPFAASVIKEPMEKQNISISERMSNLLEKLIYVIGSAMDSLYRKYR